MKPKDIPRELQSKIDWTSVRDLREIDDLGKRGAEVLKGLRQSGIDDFVPAATIHQIIFIQAGKKFASTPYLISKALQRLDGGLEHRFERMRKFRFSKPLQKPLDVVDEISENANNQLVNICERFHRAIAHLTQRRKGRPAINFADEYDVQDVFGTVLKCCYKDVRDEVWTPSYAGQSARIDFVIDDIKTAAELKRARSKQEISNELLIDIPHYAQSQNVEHLICFVYDPDGFLRRDATQIEKDLSGVRTQNGRQINVTVLIRPK
jgi:hypothetical protein